MSIPSPERIEYPPPAAAPGAPAIPHFGKPVLSPQEAAEHAAWLALAIRYHPCHGCEGGRHLLTRCATCQGRRFFLPPAVARKWGLEKFLLTAGEELDREEPRPSLQTLISNERYCRARAAWEGGVWRARWIAARVALECYVREVRLGQSAGQEGTVAA